jgi:hypothetical protein
MDGSRRDSPRLRDGRSRRSDRRRKETS